MAVHVADRDFGRGLPDAAQSAVVTQRGIPAR